MSNSIEDKLTENVLKQIHASTPRQQEILEKLVRHLHAFVKDVEPTEEEWLQAIQFLTDTGKMCTDQRQEFILFSDVTGVSMLVDAINHRPSKEESIVTESTVKGPFHAKAPSLKMGDNIARGSKLETEEPPVILRGRIMDDNGNPVDGAIMDVWQADDQGFYDTQESPGEAFEANLRGIFTTEASGEYWFRSIKPAPYPVPVDGPVGKLLRASGRHAMRPAHIHVWLQAEGHRSLITHLFVKGDHYLDSDAVFGVKDSLIVDFQLNRNKEDAKKWGVSSPFYDIVHDFKIIKL